MLELCELRSEKIFDRSLDDLKKMGYPIFKFGKSELWPDCLDSSIGER